MTMTARRSLPTSCWSACGLLPSLKEDKYIRIVEPTSVRAPACLAVRIVPRSDRSTAPCLLEDCPAGCGMRAPPRTSTPRTRRQMPRSTRLLSRGSACLIPASHCPSAPPQRWQRLGESTTLFLRSLGGASMVRASLAIAVGIVITLPLKCVARHCQPQRTGSAPRRPRR
jgi:hypothetical protein